MGKVRVGQAQTIYLERGEWAGTKIHIVSIIHIKSSPIPGMAKNFSVPVSRVHPLIFPSVYVMFKNKVFMIKSRKTPYTFPINRIQKEYRSWIQFAI